MEEFRGGGSKREKGEKISTPSHADGRMASHLFYTPILNFLVDLLCNADQGGLLDFAYVEAVAPFEGVEPVASDAALVCD